MSDSTMTPRASSTDTFDGFEERADHVTEEVLRNDTVVGDYYDRVHEALVGRGLVLIQGPRGCGKTHMMRYTWLLCREDKCLPLAVYVSFNRYLRLEPLLKNRTDALTVFQAWTLARIVQAADALADGLDGKRFDILKFFGLDRTTVDTLISRLERVLPISGMDEDVIRLLTIDAVADALEAMAKFYGRKRVVLLLDDAALTLTPEYMIEFFDIVRVLKRPRLSPKASIYPGTTEFGPRFHADHEGQTVTAWLHVEHPSYRQIMQGIALRRFPEAAAIPEDVDDYLKYAAFGVPRAYLSMLREWTTGDHKTSQQGLNIIVQSHNEARKKEFLSLGLKIPRLATVLSTGDLFFTRIVEVLRDANEALADREGRPEKQLTIGIDTSSLVPLSDRMINLLIEAGLLFEHPQVSHGGPDRTYRRLTPHLAALIAVRAFSSKSRGTSPKAVVDFIGRAASKHPIRRKLDTVLAHDKLDSLKLDLPPCQVCNTARMAESQRFCHNCGSKLVDESTYTRLMRLSFDEVPHLTEWARSRLVANNIRVIGDLLSLQDPGTELRKIYMVGRTRAERIVTAVQSYVDEFVS